MARQDKDGFVDPSLVAAWRRMLWLMRGSADVVEALVPTAAGMTKDEISRLLTRAGAPSGKGVEPVEQVLGLMGVVPRARYDALRDEYETLVKEYEELGTRVEEAEQNIERLRRMLREQGLVDEAEQLLDSWGGLVRRTLRAQAGFMRSIASGGGTAPGSTLPPDEMPHPSIAEAKQAEQETALPSAAEPEAASLPPAPRRRAPAKANGTRTGSRAKTAGPAGEDSRPPRRGQRKQSADSPEAAQTRPATRRRTTKANGTPSGPRPGRSKRST